MYAKELFCKFEVILKHLNSKKKKVIFLMEQKSLNMLSKYFYISNLFYYSKKIIILS